MITFGGKARSLGVLAVGVALGLALRPEPAAAWGDEGHKVICEIAFRLAKPTTRAEIQKLISNDERFEGHTDSMGSDAYNPKLSVAITAVGFGKTRPIAPNTTSDGKDNPDGRAKNRRVDIVVEG